MHALQVLEPASSGWLKRAGETETGIVVTVVCVPVARARPEIHWIVLPGAAAQRAKRTKGAVQGPGCAMSETQT